MLQRDQLSVNNVRLVLNVQQEEPRRVLLVITVPQEVKNFSGFLEKYNFMHFGLNNIYSGKVHDIHKYNVKII